MYYYLSGVHCIFEDPHPAFESGHLKQGYISFANMVKINARVHPALIGLQTCTFIRDDCCIQYTLAKLTEITLGYRAVFIALIQGLW